MTVSMGLFHMHVWCVWMHMWESVHRRIFPWCRRPGLHPWVGKIPWRRKWQPTPAFLPGESHRERSLAGYSPWGKRVGCDWVTNTYLFLACVHVHACALICAQVLEQGGSTGSRGQTLPSGLRDLRLSSRSAHPNSQPWSPAPGSCVSGDAAETPAETCGSFPPGSLCRVQGPPRLQPGSCCMGLHSTLWARNVAFLTFHLYHLPGLPLEKYVTLGASVPFSSVAQLCPTVCDPMKCSTPGLPVHHQLAEFTQTHAQRVGDAIKPSHPLSSPSPPAPNPSQHQGLFQWVSSSHQVAKLLEFQLQHQSFQWTPRTYLLQDGLVGSPRSPRDSQESSPTPQFKNISSSALSFLHSPTLTSIHDH